jgi:hypothetical protein
MNSEVTEGKVFEQDNSLAWRAKVSKPMPSLITLDKGAVCPCCRLEAHQGVMLDATAWLCRNCAQELALGLLAVLFKRFEVRG